MYPEAGALEYSSKAPLVSRSLLLDGTAVDGTMVVVGERGHVFVSTDNGVTWKQADVPSRATLTGVFFHDQHLGWAVGHDQVILKTHDGGRSWKQVYSSPEADRPLLDVWFADSLKGFAIRYVSQDDWHLNHIIKSDGGRLYIAAESGTIYRSDDGGESWISLPSPYEGSFFGTLPLANNTMLLFGLRGNLFRSEDAGNSWTKIQTGTEATLTAGIRLSDGTTIIVGLGGTILVSRDGGHSFILRQEADRKGFSAILQASDNTLITVGESGVKKRSIDVLTRSSSSQGADAR
ncbi:MAG: sialidase [Deltaproteobacteria bacterium]|nr:sialidase [Deltaproteobacteria bacterium]